MHSAIQWTVRSIAFIAVTYVVAVSGELRLLTKSMYVWFTDAFISGCIDYGERLDAGFVIVYFTLSAILSALLIALVEWLIKLY